MNARKITVLFHTPAVTQAGGVGPRVAEQGGGSQQKRAVLPYFSNADAIRKTRKSQPETAPPDQRMTAHTAFPRIHPVQ
jgi:hypothetical protein